MQVYYPDIPKHIELFAFCWHGDDSVDMVDDGVHKNHVYKVLRFVDSKMYFPYGVRLADMNGNELTETFFLRRFIYWEHILN